MFELIPCVVGGFVSIMLAAHVRLTVRLLVASLTGVVVAVASGEAAVWLPAVLLDASLAAASCVGVAVVQKRVARQSVTHQRMPAERRRRRDRSGPRGATGESRAAAGALAPAAARLSSLWDDQSS